MADVTAEVGDVVELAVKASAEDDESSLPPLGLLQALRQTASGAKEAEVQAVSRLTCRPNDLPSPSALKM